MLASSFHHLAKFLDWHTPQERSLCVVACSIQHILCGRSVVCGPRAHEARRSFEPFLCINGTALHVFLRLPSLPLRVVASLVRVHGSLLLSETESSVIGTKRTTHGGFLARSASSSSSWHIHCRCIERVWNHIHNATRLLETGPTISFLRSRILRLNYLAKRERASANLTYLLFSALLGPNATIPSV